MDQLLQILLQEGLINQDVAANLRVALQSDQYRTQVQNQVANIYLNWLGGQQEQLISLVNREANTIPSSLLDQIFDDTIPQELIEEYAEAATTRNVAQLISEPTIAQGLTDDTFRQIDESVLQWVRTYYTEGDNLGSIPSLNRTSREQVVTAFERWNRGELGNRGFPDFIDAISNTFGPERAERIATTEVSRIFGQSTIQMGMQLDFVTGFRWSTARDERVCPICEPLNGTVAEKSNDPSWIHPETGREHRHPAHVRCRCDLVPVVR